MEDTLIMDAVINKYFAGETSDREEQFLMAWLEESEEHRKYFFELKSIWNARNVFAESADLGRFAAFMRSTDARIAKIAGEERARRRRGLLRWSMSAAAAVLLVVCAGFAWHFLAGPDIYRVYENNTETVTTVTLDDGTQVWLNARTRLILPKAFSPTERNVKLAGAAFFEVARDEAAPFTVATDDLRVRVLRAGRSGPRTRLGAPANPRRRQFGHLAARPARAVRRGGRQPRNLARERFAPRAFAIRSGDDGQRHPA